MKKMNIKLLILFTLSVILPSSCKKNNVYDEMPVGKDLSIAYEKLLKQNKLEKDSTESIYDIGASFVIYPDNKVEQNQTSVYIIVSQNKKGVYKYIYNMTTDRFDSYKVNSVDSVEKLFAHQVFSSFEILDIVRDSLLQKSSMPNPQITNIRFYINSALNKPEVEGIIEDVYKPNNSKIFISDINGNINK